MTGNLERYTERHPRVVDTLMFLALFGCTALGTSLSVPGADLPQNDRPATLLAGMSCLVVVKARSRPRIAVVLATAAAVAIGAMGYLPTPLLLAPLMMARSPRPGPTRGHRLPDRLGAPGIVGALTMLGVSIAAASAALHHAVHHTRPVRGMGGCPARHADG